MINFFKKNICLLFYFVHCRLKVAFIQKVWCVCQISKSPKKYSKSLSWTWNLNFPPITVNNKFKFQAQDSNLEYFYFGDLDIWKTNSTFWKKATFKNPAAGPANGVSKETSYYRNSDWKCALSLLAGVFETIIAGRWCWLFCAMIIFITNCSNVQWPTITIKK